MTLRTGPNSQAATGAPMLIGEHPALDFLNSVMASAGATLDFLYDGATMGVWLKASGTLSGAALNAFEAMPRAHADQIAADARQLREHFRALLFARTKRGARGLTSDALEPLNALMAQSPLVQKLVKTSDGSRLEEFRAFDTDVAFVAELAAQCADLIANQPAGQVRKCENPACTMWFNDSKRGPRRRWCSMAVCGNRMKVAAHRARQRSGG